MPKIWKYFESYHNTNNREAENRNEKCLLFRQGEAPPHYAAADRHSLNTEYPGNGSIEWRAKSPNLNSLHYFLWTHLKECMLFYTPRHSCRLSSKNCR
jgi:hypothetical protein